MRFRASRVSPKLRGIPDSSSLIALSSAAELRCMSRCVVVVKRQALDALDEITNQCVVEREWRIRIDREIEIVVKVSDELTADAHR